MTGHAVNNYLTILHLNVRSIRNKLDDICNYLEDCDIACFSETHLDYSISSGDIWIDNYHEPYRKDRNNRGGGLLVYIKSCLMAKRRTDLENDTDEIIWSELSLHSKKVLLCTLYKPARIILVPYSSCNCGHPREDALHYFIQCPNYNAIRESMRRTVTNVGASFNIGTLLYGNLEISVIMIMLKYFYQFINI